jgi:cell division septation protein DedD
MKIVCPKCELKGQVDEAPTGSKLRIVCVRCANTFEAVFADGQMEILAPRESPAEVFVESATNGYLTDGRELTATPETLRDAHLNNSLELEVSAPSEDNSSTWSPDFMSNATGEVSASVTQRENVEEDSQKFAESDFESQTQEVSEDSQSTIAVAASLEANAASKISRPPSDPYGMGVRLMQVSPIWLLLTGLSFISFIFVCNWLIRPVEVTGDAAGLSTRTSNYASNASINRATASNSTDQSSVNNQIVQPKAESEAAFVTTQAKESPTSQQAVPDLQMIEEKRVEEEKPAMQPSSSTNSKAEGKVTVQIGSYNEAGQAEERVVSLKNAGFEARSVAIEIPKRGTWYRVQSGRFINRVEAERYGKQLRDKGVVSSFITTDIQE